MISNLLDYLPNVSEIDTVNNIIIIMINSVTDSDWIYMWLNLHVFKSEIDVHVVK